MCGPVLLVLLLLLFYKNFQLRKTAQVMIGKVYNFICRAAVIRPLVGIDAEGMPTKFLWMAYLVSFLKALLGVK